MLDHSLSTQKFSQKDINEKNNKQMKTFSKKKETCSYSIWNIRKSTLSMSLGCLWKFTFLRTQRKSWNPNKNFNHLLNVITNTFDKFFINVYSSAFLRRRIYVPTVPLANWSNFMTPRFSLIPSTILRNIRG